MLPAACGPPPAPGNGLIRKANPEMGQDLLAFGLARMNDYAIVTGSDTQSRGLLTMTDARWRSTVDFLRTAGLAKSGVDYAKGWTLSVVDGVKVLP